MQRPDDRQPLYLIDAFSLVFQAFYAIRGLKNASGMPTNAVFGFVRKMNQLLRDHEPGRMVACFDSPGPGFRHEIYPDYKANREEPPEEFHVQLPYIFRALDELGIPRLSREGFEADDVIATLADEAERRGWPVVVVTADKDLFQLVSEDVRLLRCLRDDMQLYDPKAVEKKMGVRPDQVADYLALVGDSSDNIPGVKGLGPKTATALLKEYDSVDGILENLERIEKKRWRTLIEQGRENLDLSRQLARVRRDVPHELQPEALEIHQPDDRAGLIELYAELGFNRLIREVREELGEAAPEGVGPQGAGEVDYGVAATPEALRELAARAAETGRAAIDTETDSLNTMRARLVGISISVEPGQARYIPLGHGLEDDAQRQPSLDEAREALAPLFEDRRIRRIAQNAKFDQRVLARHGFAPPPFDFDTMLASYLINPEARHGLKAMALEYLGVEMTEIDEIIGKGRSAVTMDRIEIDRCAPYACADADMTLRLEALLRERLERDQMLGLLQDMEMPLVAVLEAMEAEGVAIDREVLAELERELESKLARLAEEIYRIAGRSFNIGSPKQVGELLFDEIGLKTRRRTKTGYSTSHEVLSELAKSHPLPGRILEYRHYDKMLSTYIRALPELVHPETGRIHTSFNQFVAATGRLSSSEPNLQNIPARTELGRKIRSAFVPNREGEVLMAADYSQIELRILAHFSGDEALLQVFRENRDIHTQTAMRIFDCEAEFLTKDMRSQAKVVNFGILYGMSAHRLSRELDIPHAQAQAFIDEYFAAYPGVKEWSEALLRQAAERGYVETLVGRRRLTPNLEIRNRQQRANAERMAINMPIQGTAADLIKIAMLRVAEAIDAEGWAARMILQVHDELVFTVPEAEVEALSERVTREMEGAMELAVPLRVDVKTGRNWAEC